MGHCDVDTVRLVHFLRLRGYFPLWTYCGYERWLAFTWQRTIPLDHRHTCPMQRKSRKLLSRTLTDLLRLWLQESTLKHPFMTDDYSPDDVTARVGGPVYKPIINSNLLAMLSDDRTANGLVMPEARCKWSALWKAASGARCHWQSVEADDGKSDSASQE